MQEKNVGKQGLMIAAVLVAGCAFAIPADAQRVRQGERWVTMPRPGVPPQAHHDPARWGDRVDGGWWAGARAPGGWAAYRRPLRGWTLPGFWLSGSFGIPDYLSWGLASPPYGYHWVRYYDDAVLVDDRGEVWDAVYGIDWAGGGGGAYAESTSFSTSHASVGAGYPPPQDARIVTPAPGYDDRYYSDDQGYYDRDDRDRYGDDYYADDRYDRPGVSYAPPAEIVQALPAPRHRQYPVAPTGGCATACAGYAGSGYYYVQPSITTIVVQSGPAVTTTTTTVTEEIVEERTTTYRAPARVVRRSGKLIRR